MFNGGRVEWIGMGSGGDRHPGEPTLTSGYDGQKSRKTKHSHSMVKLYERKGNYFLFCDVCR